MSVEAKYIQLDFPPSLGHKSHISKQEALPIRDLRDMSPRSTMADINRLEEGKKSDTKKQHIPKAPIKKVSFLPCETIPNNTQHTQETISTVKEEIDYYYDQDDEACNYDDRDYDSDSQHEEDGYDSNSDDDNDNDGSDHEYEVDGDMDVEDENDIVASPAKVVQATKPTKTSRRRKIRWSGQVRVQEIRHINNVSESVREAVWMSPIDYKMIKNMAKTTVLMMMAGERIGEEDPDFCSRGLEFRTRKGQKMRSANKLRCRSAVLNEQDLQREEGFHDPEFIAMASLDVSYDCREQAQKRGNRDAEAILIYVNDVPRKVKVMLF